MDCLPRPVMIRIWSQPEAMASSTPYWMMGLSTSGSISLGWALVAGRKRVPRPAAGNTALRTFMVMGTFVGCPSLVLVVGQALPGSDHCNWSLHTYAMSSGTKGLGCRLTRGELLTSKSKTPPSRIQRDKGGHPVTSPRAARFASPDSRGGCRHMSGDSVLLFADYQHYEAVWEDRRIAAGVLGGGSGARAELRRDRVNVVRLCVESHRAG